MNIFKSITTSAFLIIFCLIAVADSFAQRNLSYPDLAMRSQQSDMSFDYLTLPGSDEDLVQFAMVFHLPYSSLPFKKNRDRSSNNQYFSTLNLILEVFKANESNFDNKNKEDISLNGLEAAGRAFWEDTAYAKNYEASKSDNNFLSGFIKINLQPDTYNYVLQMKRGDQSESRISRVQNIKLDSYKNKKVGNILVSPNYVEQGGTGKFILNTTGNAVEYAKDFYAVGYIPEYKEDNSYTLEVTKLNVFSEDTTKQNTVFTKELTSEDIKPNLYPKLHYEDKKPYLNLVESDNSYTYAILEIPNSNFQNALYQIAIKDSNGKIIARDNYRSKWEDMPVSLLNLEVAIEMLRFMVDKDKIREINSGSAAEREKKFRAFWKERDPTPDTEFNELMSEYYRRIDYAYKNYSTENILGYNSARGEVYIKFGPPNDVNRKFPKSGPTTEVWTYPNQKFIFQATSGFGDFKLISKESR